VDTYSTEVSAFFLPGEWQVFAIKAYRRSLPLMAARAGS
jgi:hypothetical protein